MPDSNIPRKSFVKEHLLPVLLVFMIPGFAAWFFGFAERRTDREILSHIESDIQRDASVSADEKARALDFHRTLPVSRIMASDKPEAAELQRMFAPVQTRYAIFRWMKRIAWICLATIGVTFLIVGLSVAFSLRSHRAQYNALRIGWPVLRTSAAIQVLGQAVLAVALSFWITVILTESYYIKLIVMIGLLAGIAVIALWKAIFSKVNDRCEVAGAVVSDDEAPDLWRRVREIAGRLDTQAPDRIIVGIDANFFVTEHPVELEGQVQDGRSLYLSLPMLKVLSWDEADAVLAHELAHFSGQDTFWSRKIAPLRGKFALYLQLLGHGLSLVVAHFMHFFWKLYGLSMQRLSREREFRADRIGAELVSGEAMKRALIKITCYCNYRDETEMGVLCRSRVDQELNLARQLEQGYPAFLSSITQSEKVIDDRVPHPFDSHPTLNNRLTKLGFEAHVALQDAEIQQPAQHSWYEAITTAPAVEGRMWAERQQALQIFHGTALGWRLMPKDEEEAAIVREHFPRLVLRTKKGAEATLEFDRVQIAGWGVPILFRDIREVKLEATLTSKRLTLIHTKAGQTKPAKTRFYPGSFVSDQGNLLTLFGHYYSRHKTAEAWSRGAVE